MSGSRTSVHEALYHVIPQEPLPAQPIPLEGEPEEVTDNVDSLPLKLEVRIRWIHFVFGCAVLLPWNAIITAIPYFLSRLEGSPIRPTFSSYLSFIATGTGLVFLVHATASVIRANHARRVFCSSLTLALVFLILTSTTLFRFPKGLFAFLILLCVFAQGATGSYLQTSVMAVAALFGPSTLQAVMSGQAAVAVVVSSVQLFSVAASLWRLPPEKVLLTGDGKAEERAAFLFFGLSSIFLLGVAGVQTWLTTMPAYKALLRPSLERQRREGEAADERESLVSSGREHEVSVADDRARIWSVAKANIVFEVAICYVFSVTLSVFPAITTSIQPTNPNTHPLIFTALHFVIFNIGDFLGRFICSYPQVLIWSANKLLTLSVSRTLFIPLFLMCNIQRSSAPPTPAPVISSDNVFFVILFAFGWSNGYVANLSMMFAPSLEHNPRLKGKRENVEVAGTLGTFCLVSGLVLGSAASFGVRALECGCNPFQGQ